MSTYEQALERGRRVGAAHANRESLLAQVCMASAQFLAGAVNPERVFEGANKRGMTAHELTTLSPEQINALQWD